MLSIFVPHSFAGKLKYLRASPIYVGIYWLALCVAPSRTVVSALP